MELQSPRVENCLTTTGTSANSGMSFMMDLTAFCKSLTVSELGLRAPIPRIIRSQPVGRRTFLATAVKRGRGEAAFLIGARGEKTDNEGR